MHSTVTRRSWRSEAALSISHNKNVVKWGSDLSYETLKDAGLVSNFNEYQSIKTAFYFKNVAPNFIIKWLKNQRCTFRVSYLSHVLLDGYTKQFITRPCTSMDVGNIILAYCNITFIKCYENGTNNSDYTLQTFDANLSINNLIQILQLENSTFGMTKKPMRIWSRFNAIEWIYSEVQSDAQNTDYDYTKCDKWVQIPESKCSDLTIAEIDSQLPYHKTLEFGVDQLGTHNGVTQWMFMRSIASQLYSENWLEWLCSLSKGDMIDAYCGMKWNEVYIIRRDYDTFYVKTVNDCSDNYFAIKSIGYALNRLQPRYTHCEYYKIDSSAAFAGNHTHIYAFNKLVYCEWVAAFAGNSLSCYPILIE